ncbi:hypothetical protein [Algicella marina]|uniref:Uncharacterized protein n=1 Tax=Algicella marina TaxID=2683284 RepID=A0A6P1T016_9RHOB|nr:hypothetical protein [Algicella marina]QHQ34619.1 hypothetical protein GO499_05145 [Algicella marina]
MRTGQAIAALALTGIVITGPAVAAPGPLDSARAALRAVLAAEGVFAVTGGGIGEASWCVAGRFAKRKLGLDSDAAIRRLSRISPKGLGIRSPEGRKVIPGPGALYSYADAGALENYQGRNAETRTVSAAVAACG